MFVDTVSSEYDLDFLEEFTKTASKWNHHEVRQLDDDSHCSKALEFTQKGKAQSLTGREIKPMMSSCSGKFRQNPDGSWEIEGKIEFKTRDDKEKENTNENSDNQGTTAANNDPPDSRDRAEPDHDQ